MDELMNEIIEIIEKKIRERGWTKKQFAEKIGKSQGWLNNKLKEHRKLTVDDMELIAKGFGESLANLFPTPQNQIDAREMTILDLIRHVCKAEIEVYLDKNKITGG